MKKYDWQEWRNSLSPNEQCGTLLTLSENGECRYRIIISINASEIEKSAAGELECWLHKISDAHFPILTDDNMPVDNEICVGVTSRGKPDIEPGIDGISIQQKGKRLFLFGGKGRGLINAVFSLLEEDIGCRWYASDAERITRQKTLKIAPAARTYSPQLKMRDPFYFCSFDGEWSLHNRTNAPGAPVLKDFGGYMSYAKTDRPKSKSKRWYRNLLFVHTYHQLLPPEIYADEHPEYFEMNEEGQRLTHRQLCETNQDVQRIVAESALVALRKTPEAKLISISKVDGGSTCQCESCKALNLAEGSNAASMLTLVNYVAKTIEKEFPEVTVTTLAYLDTIKPPKTIKPRANVSIRLCNDKCAWPHPFKSIREFPEFGDIVKEWASVCQKLYIWDYNVNFSHYAAPMPNLEVIADNIRFWCANNAEGLLTQGAFQSHGAERDLMKAWIIAKLMWNPALDVFELAQDFIWGYFDQAAPAISKYNQLLYDQKEKYATELASPAGGIRYSMNEPFLADGFVENADALYQNAFQLGSQNKTLTARIERDYLPLLYVKIQQSMDKTSPECLKMVTEFERIARHSKFLFVGETQEPSLDWQLQMWRVGKTGGMVSFNPPPGSYDGPLKVHVSSQMAAVRLTYTIDGSKPAFNTANIDGPIEITASCTLKIAMIMLGSCCGSTIAEVDYHIMNSRKAEYHD
jgi:energy-converting hydrogenase Eha subunit C